MDVSSLPKQTLIVTSVTGSLGVVVAFSAPRGRQSNVLVSALEDKLSLLTLYNYYPTVTHVAFCHCSLSLSDCLSVSVSVSVCVCLSVCLCLLILVQLFLIISILSL